METYDLIIIGTGTGNMMLSDEFSEWNVALVERDVFGGTCLNRGCIPSKMFVLAADRALAPRSSAKLGVDLSLDDVRFEAIVERVFGRIDPIVQGGDDYREAMSNVTVVRGDARFTGPKVLEVDGRDITAPIIVIAAGARVVVPGIRGLEETGFQTSDTIMRSTELPKRMAVLGGGYIANELGHVFEAFGSEVTMIVRSDRLLRSEDRDVCATYRALAQERFDVRFHTAITNVARVDTGIELTLTHAGADEIIEVDELLVAVGRQPNGHQLDVAASGVDLDNHGYVTTNAFGQTNVEGIWAVGDVSNPAQLKHTANAEGRVVAHNILNPGDQREISLDPIPHAVFTSPQIASVGATEQELEGSGTNHISAIHHYRDTAYGWAMEDTTSFCKVIADPDTRLLLGAHIIGAQAATLIQPLIMGMKLGLTVDEIAKEPLYIHPALTEVVENALLQL